MCTCCFIYPTATPPALHVWILLTFTSQLKWHLFRAGSLITLLKEAFPTASLINFLHNWDCNLCRSSLQGNSMKAWSHLWLYPQHKADYLTHNRCSLNNFLEKRNESVKKMTTLCEFFLGQYPLRSHYNNKTTNYNKNNKTIENLK